MTHRKNRWNRGACDFLQQHIGCPTKSPIFIVSESDEKEKDRDEDGTGVPMTCALRFFLVKAFMLSSSTVASRSAMYARIHMNNVTDLQIMDAQAWYQLCKL